MRKKKTFQNLGIKGKLLVNLGTKIVFYPKLNKDSKNMVILFVSALNRRVKKRCLWVKIHSLFVYMFIFMFMMIYLND